jgi:hypothetical protein
MWTTGVVENILKRNLDAKDRSGKSMELSGKKNKTAGYELRAAKRGGKKSNPAIRVQVSIALDC